MDIEKRVFLLAIYKKKDDESLKDVIAQMEDAKVFNFKEGKKLLKEFKNEKLIVNSTLSFSGIQQAQEIEQEFKI
ncbi:hypothetical protein A9Q76_06675 [Arcobacter sp. 31_11_sub10_T18]|nr:hypothetical protein A9Q76_06675 [Arcobacter sp. 31_11_sub10_T18]